MTQPFEALPVEAQIRAEPIKVFAILNHGRWVGACPDCASAEIVTRGAPFICSAQYPDVRLNDADKRKRAYQIALMSGHVYNVVFPDNKEEIDAHMKKRRNEINRNWSPGESMADLQREFDENTQPKAST